MPSDDERPNGSNAVLDSSAYLALILVEPGHEFVRDAVAQGAGVSSVNLAEVVSRLRDLDYSLAMVEERLLEFAVPVLPFSQEHGKTAGSLRSATRHLGLSLVDRACLAVAAELDVPAITADRLWVELDIGVQVVLCR
ncbi:MAG TPA: type II toxin-antitoxin system VapC family toxin [Dehalococcoidia bacterium]|nr:type II toxin-antitoxin system VapC family toxin [Dehalococcoidia bacterium]